MEHTTYKREGYILVESLVAATIVVSGLLGIFALLSQSLGLNRVVSERYTATYLSAEGIEIVKNVMDNNVINGRPWNAGVASGEYEADDDDLSLSSFSGRRLMFDSANGRYSYAGGDETPFSRKIIIEQLGGGNEVKINSIVEWSTRGDAEFKVNLESRFFNWK